MKMLKGGENPFSPWLGSGHHGKKDHPHPVASKVGSTGVRPTSFPRWANPPPTPFIPKGRGVLIIFVENFFWFSKKIF